MTKTTNKRGAQLGNSNAVKDDPRTETIQFRVTPEFKAALQERAAQQSKTLTSYIVAGLAHGTCFENEAK